jgi:capsular exopolysaccharide synthesis family protein
MSKHFELMQQIENERLFPAEAEAEAGTPAAVLDAHRDETEVAVMNGRYAGDAVEELQGDLREGTSGWASEEALRLVQQIFLLQSQEPPRVAVFASVDHGNGCSRICASVAETLARNDRGRVCLVEANFRSPALPGMFGVTNHYGLTEALLHEGPIDGFTRPLNQENLWLLSSGTVAADSPSLLATDHLRERIAELRQQFDFVIVDAPPLNRYSDAVALGQLSDGVVMVIEANATRREAAVAVVENLRSVNVPILAAVLNKRTFPIPEKIYNLL